MDGRAWFDSRQMRAKNLHDHTRQDVMMATMERLTLTVDEAAKLLGVSRGTAYEMINQGKFPVEPVRVGRRILIPKYKLFQALGLENGEHQ